MLGHEQKSGQIELEDFFADGTSTLEAIHQYWEALVRRTGAAEGGTRRN